MSKRWTNRIGGYLFGFLSILFTALMLVNIDANAMGLTQLTTNQECSVWEIPSTDEEFRVKKIPAGQTVTVYTDEIYDSWDGDGKQFYRTAKDCYILCKCLGNGGPVNTYKRKYGSCEGLDGRTLVVTVFTNDYESDWTYAYDLKRELLFDETIAYDWLEKQCLANGVAADFIYDWTIFPDLAYNLNLSGYALDPEFGFYTKCRQNIISCIDVDALMAKYSARNIVFLMALNIQMTNEIRSAAWAWAPYQTRNPDIELVRLLYWPTPINGAHYYKPSTIAHETLHAFGAPDLYQAGYTITEQYVDYLDAINSKDIMKWTAPGYDPQCLMTPITSYYVGFLPDHPDVHTFGLGLYEKYY